MDITKIIKGLLKKYSINKLRSVIISNWAHNNSIPIKKLLSGEVLSDAIRKGGNEDVGSHVNGLSIKTLKDVEIAFEALIDIERRKKQGAVYTPDFIIDYLLQNTIDRAIETKTIGEIAVSDPACGSGGFLIRAACLLAKRQNSKLGKVISKQLIGIDNDAHAIYHAKCLIELLLVSENEDPKECILNLHCLDTLTSSPEKILKEVNRQNGFDVIVTNPPYVKLQNLDNSYRENLCSKYPQFIKGSFSLSILFLIAGHRLLSSEGYLGYITQNNIFTSLAGENVREYLQQNLCVRRIVDFGHNHIFVNASAYTCLMFLSKKSDKDFEFAPLWKNVTSESLNKLSFSKMSFGELNAKKWRLGKRSNLNNLRKIEQAGTPIGKAFDIKVGFATLKDKVYFVRVLNDKCIAVYNNKDYEVEKEITKPAVKIAELTSEDDLASNNLRIIFPYNKVNNQFSPMEEKELKRKYPLAYAYLCNAREELLTRDKGKTEIYPWYAWGRTQSMDLRGPKLLTKTFSNYPNFIYDESDQLFCNGYAIFLKKKNDLFSLGLSLQDLKLFLNSAIMDYYTKLTSFQLEGNYQCYQKNFIEKFCIPDLGKINIKELRGLRQKERDAVLAEVYGLEIEEIQEVC